MKHDALIQSLFSHVGETTAMKAVKKLNDYNIYTVQQLYGAIYPDLPRMPLFERKLKGLLPSYTSTVIKSNSDQDVIKKVKHLTNLDEAAIKALLNKITKYNVPVSNFHFRTSALSLGLKKSMRMNKSQVIRPVTTYFSSAPRSFVLPGYEKNQLVYDQGTRGTCVSQAICAMLQYQKKDNFSRQFHYHQCKMIDGIKNSEGTYLQTGFKILDDQKIIDYGVPLETSWRYHPDFKTTTHQGPPPEICFNTQRIVAGKTSYARPVHIIEDVKQLLYGGIFGKAAAVVIGVALYESFSNRSTNLTGWVTMPLPGERIIGYHAMLVVGYFENPDVFLIRNSWGNKWAPQNKFGYPGHGLFPFEYLKKYCFVAATSNDFQLQKMVVPPGKRLYDKKSSALKPEKNAASPRKRKPKKGYAAFFENKLDELWKTIRKELDTKSFIEY